MKRRAVLASLTAGVAGVAGCQTLGDRRRQGTFGVPETSTDDEPDTTTDAGSSIEPPDGLRKTVTSDLGPGPGRRLTLVGNELTTAPRGTRLIAGFREPPTTDSPAEVWVGIENATNSRETVRFGPTPPYSQYWATQYRAEDDQRLYFLLVPDDQDDFPYRNVSPSGPTGGRWEATAELGQPVEPIERNDITLEPGEGVSGTYHLLAHPESESYQRRGIFTFDWADWSSHRLGLSVDAPTDGVPEPSLAAGDLLPPLPAGNTRFYQRIPWMAETPPVYAHADVETLSIESDRTRVVLENRSARTVRAGPQYLYKLSEMAWKPIGPWRPPDDPPRVPPAGIFETEFVPREADLVVEAGEEIGDGDARADDDGTTTTTPTVTEETTTTTPTVTDPPAEPSPVVGSRTLRIGGLGPGRYALLVALVVPRDDSLFVDSPVSVKGGLNDPDEYVIVPDEAVSVATLLELEGDPVELTPTDAVADVRRDGDTVYVEVRPNARETETDRETLVVAREQRTTTEESGLRLLTEQIMQFSALRNGLAHFEDGVDFVRVQTTDWQVRRPLLALGDDSGESLTFTHDGETFSARLSAVRRGGEETSHDG